MKSVSLPPQGLVLGRYILGGVCLIPNCMMSIVGWQARFSLYCLVVVVKVCYRLGRLQPSALSAK